MACSRALTGRREVLERRELGHLAGEELDLTSTDGRSVQQRERRVPPQQMIHGAFVHTKSLEAGDRRGNYLCEWLAERLDAR
jgi:hypothetical protein